MILLLTKISTLQFTGLTRRVRFKCKYQVLWRPLMELTLKGNFLFRFIFIGRFFIWTFSTWWLSKKFNQEVEKNLRLCLWWEDFEHELSKIKKISKCRDENIILKQKVPSLFESNWSWECLLLLSLVSGFRSKTSNWTLLAFFDLILSSTTFNIELSNFLFVPGLLLSCHNW